MTGIAPDPFSFPFHSNKIIIIIIENTGNLPYAQPPQWPKSQEILPRCRVPNEKVSMFVNRCKEIIHQLNNLITRFCIVKVAEPCV